MGLQEAALRLSIVAPININAPSFTSLKEWINSFELQTTPAMVSLVPLINFVKLWITTSAPNFAGEIDSGVNVLSTISFNPLAFAILEIDSISATSSNGLDETSQYIILVFDLINFFIALISVMSIKSVSIPIFDVKFFKNA